MCAIVENPLPSGLDSSGQSVLLILAYLLKFLGFCQCKKIAFKGNLKKIYLQTSLLCTKGSKQGEGPWLLALVTSDK